MLKEPEHRDDRNKDKKPSPSVKMHALLIS